MDDMSQACTLSSPAEKTRSSGRDARKRTVMALPRMRKLGFKFAKDHIDKKLPPPTSISPVDPGMKANESSGMRVEDRNSKPTTFQA